MASGCGIGRMLAGRCGFRLARGGDERLGQQQRRAGRQSRLQSPGTGTDIGASSSSATRPAPARPVMTASAAESGSSPAAATSRPGASSAAQAKFDGWRTEPMSAATTRILMPPIQLRLLVHVTWPAKMVVRYCPRSAATGVVRRFLL